MPVFFCNYECLFHLDSEKLWTEGMIFNNRTPELFLMLPGMKCIVLDPNKLIVKSRWCIFDILSNILLQKLNSVKFYILGTLHDTYYILHWTFCCKNVDSNKMILNDTTVAKELIHIKVSKQALISTCWRHWRLFCFFQTGVFGRCYSGLRDHTTSVWGQHKTLPRSVNVNVKM